MFKCYYCGCLRGELLASKNEIRLQAFGFEKQIFKCCSCGLVQMFPLWTKEESDQLYTQYSVSVPFKACKKKSIRSKRVSYKKLLNLIPTKEARILDIGCGEGDAIRYLYEKGYKNITGVEKNPVVCDGSRILHHDFLNDDLLNIAYYDFIFSLCVYNYIYNPQKFIGNIVSMLKPGGWFVLETYNIDDPLISLYRNRAFQKFQWDPYNCFYYDNKTIYYMFEKNDLRFKVELAQRYGLSNHINWILRGVPSNYNFKIPIVDNIYSFILTKLFKKSDTMLIIGQKC